ncbi:hypothetical protein IFM89_027325 [Coptis chinensis]|uniref:Disease resistance protein n=1 Tax=Coptis chinensis TaxID=261450 RepID=A0A835LZW3_9MAGN|nr:hypothetical protein IFM89_027325 [Coptis chinensis]
MLHCIWFLQTNKRLSLRRSNLPIPIHLCAKVYEPVPCCRDVGHPCYQISFCHSMYLVHYKKNVQYLETMVDKLENTHNDIERMVEVARERGELIKYAVEAWLSSVDLHALRDEAKWFQCEVEGINSFFKGWRSRYHLGKAANLKIYAINKIYLDGKSFGNTVSFLAPPPSLESLPIADFVAFGSTKSVMEEVIAALKDDRVSIVAVYGMGGVGKTTLMKQVAKDIIKDKLFDKVVMTIVSQNPDLRNDLWTRLELAEVGIPNGNEHSGCKVVFTTRSLDACCMMNSQAKIEVHTLSQLDSWNLFRYHATDIVYSDGLHKIASEVVNKCDGLPLALVTLGRALQGRDRIVWEDAALQLGKSIFPQVDDHKIIVEDDLLRYAIGERILKNVDNLMEAKIRLHKVVDSLIASGLMLRVRRSTVVNGHILDRGGIMMHDVVRDVATVIASEDTPGFIVRAGIGLKLWPGHLENIHNCRRMSLMMNDIIQLPEQSECPQLLTLSLRGNRRLQKIPDRFFEGMRSLVTLDLSYTDIQSLPPSLSWLAKLRVLHLNECANLSDVSYIGKCKKLEILELGCEFSITGFSLKLPIEIMGVANLKLLNLYRGETENIPPNIISSFSGLEELHMLVNEFGDGSSCASFAEVASLTCLISLRLRVQNATFLTKDAAFGLQNLQTFSILVNASDNIVYRFALEYRTRTMFLNMLGASEEFAPWVSKLLGKTEYLELWSYGQEYLKNVGQLDAGGQFNKLKCLRLIDCPKIEHILSVDVTDKSVPLVAFSKLTDLSMLRMEGMKEICKGPVPLGCFLNLKEMHIQDCNNLRYLFSLAMAQRLNQLEQLRVCWCSEMLNIIIISEMDEKTEPVLVQAKLFPRLKILTLSGLPMLFGFYEVHNLYSESGLPWKNYMWSANLKKLPMGPNSAPNLKQLRSGYSDLMQKIGMGRPNS